MTSGTTSVNSLETKMLIMQLVDELIDLVSERNYINWEYMSRKIEEKREIIADLLEELN